jgi:hypothetical protein
VVSLLTEPPAEDRLVGLTVTSMGKAADDRTTSDRSRRRIDLWLSIVLAGCVALIWLSFTG